MTKADLTLVFESADDRENFKITPYPNNNMECTGIAYWTEKRPVTLEGAVSLVRWQAWTMGGFWDGAMLQETLIYLKDKAILLSSKKPTIPEIDVASLA